jgi:ATP dependent DNA ligase domain
MARKTVKSSTSTERHPPTWIEPQLTRLTADAPDGPDWLHEIKYDGYRMHARIDGDDIRLLTRTGLDWTHRYKATIAALRALRTKAHTSTENSVPSGPTASRPSVDCQPRWTKAEQATSSSTPSISYFSMVKARWSCR